MDTYKHTVQYYETDKMGITHHSNYIRWMEEARVHLLRESGWGFTKMEELGLTSPVVSLECKYKHISRFEDEISIVTFIESIKGVKLKIRYLMLNSEEQVIFEGSSEHAFYRGKRPLNIAKELPEFYASMEEHMAFTSQTRITPPPSTILPS